MAVECSTAVTNKILAHYDANARILPWRSAPGSAAPDPYRVWLSEIMLQQTTVAAVKPYFEAFTQRWPNVTGLAAADDADVMTAWAGLGYYARARNLLACARVVAADYGGQFPEDETTLRLLPGIGSYTAAAIAAIAFGKRAVVVDGNVERVVARLFAVEAPMPGAKSALKARADTLTPTVRAGDFAQAMMDLGATICSPKSPKCAICPIVDHCAGKADPARYPVKPPKAAKLHRNGTALWLEHDGHVLLERRPDTGLLGGMLALPSEGWDGVDRDDMTGAPLGAVTHVFTHFTLNLRIVGRRIDRSHATASGEKWWPIDQIEEAGLPSLFLKAARRARQHRDCL